MKTNIQNEFLKVQAVMRPDLFGLPVMLDTNSFQFNYCSKHLPDDAYSFSRILSVLTDAKNATIYHKSNFSTSFEVLNFSVDFLERDIDLFSITIEIEILRNDQAYACLCAYLYSTDKLSAISNACFSYSDSK